MKILELERDGYYSLCWPNRSDLSILNLWEKCPDLVIGKYLVNTSYDSGRLTLSDEKMETGWRMIGALAHSPRIRSTDEIPHDQFDEWLVFDRPVVVEKFETFVNYTTFSPTDEDWDWWERESFWTQVLRLNPLHVIGENDAVYVVSRDKDLISKLRLV